MAKDLAAEIAKALAEYSEEVVEEVDKAAEETTAETVKFLRETSPKRKGKYAKSWRKKQLKNGRWVVYNVKHYRLTHLLERGHTLRNGGRTKAMPHIAPAEEYAVNKFEERVRRLGQ